MYKPNQTALEAKFSASLTDLEARMQAVLREKDARLQAAEQGRRHAEGSAAEVQVRDARGWAGVCCASRRWIAWQGRTR